MESEGASLNWLRAQALLNRKPSGYYSQWKSKVQFQQEA
jgi:hypothetical protein